MDVCLFKALSSFLCRTLAPSSKKPWHSSLLAWSQVRSRQFKEKGVLFSISQAVLFFATVVTDSLEVRQWLRRGLSQRNTRRLTKQSSFSSQSGPGSLPMRASSGSCKRITTTRCTRYKRHIDVSRKFQHETFQAMTLQSASASFCRGVSS